MVAEGYARSPSHLGGLRSRSAMAALRVRRDNSALSGGCEPTWRTLQPEATGAVMDVTKWLNPQQGASGARRLHSGAVAPRATKASPDERGGNRHAQPNATAPVELTCLNLLSGTVPPGASFLLRDCPLCGPSLSLRSACPSEGPALSGPSLALIGERKAACAPSTRRRLRRSQVVAGQTALGVMTPRRSDGARRPALDAGRYPPSAAPRVRSVNERRDNGRPQ
jgi:hypothetical protein